MARRAGVSVAGVLPRSSLLAACTLATVLHLLALRVLNEAAPRHATAGRFEANAAAVSVRMLPALRDGAMSLSRQARAAAPPPPGQRLTKAEGSVTQGPALSAPAPADANANADAGVQLMPHPRSAPDLEQLHGLAFSGLPMRIRLLIDDHGRVTDAKVLEASEADNVTAAVLRVFEQTAFVPARRNGTDVASELDIELSFGS